MKKLSIIAFIAISAFLSFGFVLLSDSEENPVQLEEVQVTEQSSELEPVQVSNDDMW